METIKEKQILNARYKAMQNATFEANWGKSNKQDKSVLDILNEMVETFTSKTNEYGGLNEAEPWEKIGRVMACLFPNGISLKTEEEFNRWYLFEMIVIKVTRYANSKLTHKDSLRDAGVYCAMAESSTSHQSKEIETAK